MSVHAAPKLPAYAAVAGLGLLAALVLRRPEPLVLAAPFLLFLVVGLALARAPKLTINTRLDRQRALEAEEVGLEIELAASGPVERLEVLPGLPDGLAPTEQARVLVLRLAAGERRHVRYRIRCRRWGGYQLGELRLRGHDPLGLLNFEAGVAGRMALRVYPRQEALRALPRPAQTQALTGNQVARQSGDGIEFAELRDFLPGDRVRLINWRASARRGHLIVNRQHPERNADVVLFLDTFLEVAAANGGTLDLTVRAAASLARRYLERRDRVGLISFGGDLRWLTPSLGPAQFYRIVEALLDTQILLSYAWKDIDVIPARTLPPKALIVAITPLLDERSIHALLNLHARGFDLAIVEISPVPLVQPERSDAGRLAYRLWPLLREARRHHYQRLGIPVATWLPGQPLDAPMEEVLAFQRFARRVHA